MGEGGEGVGVGGGEMTRGERTERRDIVQALLGRHHILISF